MLEPLGQELVHALSGAEALEKLHDGNFTLVLMDVHMPTLDGFSTVEAIRKRSELKHLPVMFLTAVFRDPDSEARGYSLGAVDFVTKPFVPEIVRAKVAAFVSLHKYNRQVIRQQQRIAEETAARALADVANRTKDEFIAILGHDLRNPLNAILMTAAKHGMEPAASDTCRELARRISRSAERMNRLINQVVDLAASRLGAGIPITPKPVDMERLCRVPIEEMKAIHPHASVSLHVEGDMTGEWDADRVVQVIANLIGNAIKHGAHGLQESIRVSLRGDDTAVVLQVHNSGDPIPPSKLPHLFEPFTRGEHRREGLGLGLYIVQQIVQAHGGTIGVESSHAAGTTFTVRWPRHHPMCTN